jgi:hypothetical protein
MSNLLTQQCNFRLPPRHQARQHPATAMNPFAQLQRGTGPILLVDASAQG